MGVFDLNPFTGQLDKVSTGGGVGPPGPIGPPGPAGEDGRAATIVFIDRGNTSDDSFLSLQQSANFPSNESPFMSPFDADVIALSFINENDSIDIDLEIRVNGTIALTWSLTTVRRAIKTNGLGVITIVAGDRISVSAINVSAIKPRDVILHMNLAYTSDVEQEITSATL